MERMERMERMDRIPAVLEYNGEGCLLYARDAPGAFARGRTAAEAARKLPEDVRRYCRWAGEPLPPENTTVTIVQEKESALRVCDADSDVLFDSERPPLAREAYVRLRALCLRSARDFQRLFDSIPDPDGTVLEARQTFYGPLPRTAREMYAHTMGVNAYYFREIGVEAGNGPTIGACRAAGFALLEAQNAFLDNRMFHGSYDEDWTLRKVLRRFLWHDRIHARAMYRMAVRLCGAAAVADPFFFGKNLGGNGKDPCTDGRGAVQ